MGAGRFWGVASLDEALDAIEKAGQRRVRAQLLEWSGGIDPKWQQVASNIAEETALVLAEFCRLLVRFAELLGLGGAAADAWVGACRESQLVGGALEADDRPEVIGRALGLSSYSDLLRDDTGLSSDVVKDLVREAVRSGKKLNPRLRRKLERTRVGRFVVWATFDRAQGDRHPFETFVHSTANVRDALGLGHHDVGEPLILIAYRSHGLELRRPTVADAAKYEWYRPHGDAAHPHGWTQPLPPNTAALLPQPEIVHAEALARDLVLPLYCTA